MVQETIGIDWQAMYELLKRDYAALERERDELKAYIKEAETLLAQADMIMARFSEEDESATGVRKM